MPKYSIIIPSYNGMPYLKAAVDTIISQNYNDYELILSEDHSPDETAAYIDSIEDKHVIKLHCPDPKRSMAEHWEWALSHASGEWIMFLGQDDGLLGYFFELADILTKKASQKGINIIVANRAYYFWDGCEPVYGNVKVSYSAQPFTKVKSTMKQTVHALTDLNGSYHFLPQMYANSLYHRSVLERAKQNQDGKVFITHPQDANLAAIASCLEEKYLFSGIPLGWVGSSVKSAGMATTIGTSDVLKDEKITKEYDSYNKSIQDSVLKVSPLVGSNVLFSNHICFWNALLLSKSLGNDKLYKAVTSDSFKKKMFSSIAKEIYLRGENKFQLSCFEQLLNCNNIKANFYGKEKNKFIFSMLFYKLSVFFHKVFSKINRVFKIRIGLLYQYVIYNNHVELKDVNSAILEKLDKYGYMKKI